MLRDFIAIDFETANQEPSSVCSVGVVMVRDGQIVDSFYSLIQPEPNYYNYWCQRVHGISQDDTEDAPVFSKVWQQLEERIVDVYFADHSHRQQQRFEAGDWAATARTVCGMLSGYRRNGSRDSPSDTP